MAKVFEINKININSQDNNKSNFTYKIQTHLPETDFIPQYEMICKNFLFWLFNIEKSLFLTELKCLRKIAFFRLIKDKELYSNDKFEMKMSALNISTSIFDTRDSQPYNDEFESHLKMVMNILGKFKSSDEAKTNTLILDNALKQVENRFNLSRNMTISLHAGNWSINVSQKVKEIIEDKSKRHMSIKLAILKNLINVLTIKGGDTKVLIDMFYSGKMEINYDCRSINID